MTDNANVKWEDPPEDRRHRTSEYDAMFAILRANPGRWGVVWEGGQPHQKANYIKQKIVRIREHGQWEVRASSTRWCKCSNADREGLRPLHRLAGLEARR